MFTMFTCYIWHVSILVQFLQITIFSLAGMLFGFHIFGHTMATVAKNVNHQLGKINE